MTAEWHSEFWVTAATIGPLLITAHGLTQTQTLGAGTLRALNRLEQRRQKLPARLNFAAAAAASVGGVLAMFASLHAIRSLGAQQDRGSIVADSWYLGTSIVLLLVLVSVPSYVAVFIEARTGDQEMEKLQSESVALQLRYDVAKAENDALKADRDALEAKLDAIKAYRMTLERALEEGAPSGLEEDP